MVRQTHDIFYLLAIDTLEKDHLSIRNTDIAQKLAVSPSSVTKMLVKLEKQALISHSKNQIQLTERGKQIVDEFKWTYAD
ncbi:metal-dependent transcriptional regulator [Listeria costaricensis]|uniref:metal-dependent transcriptional regulator n=1 Tax=Listeria costaricensis TaxID=2026604 RepID=UPI000C083A2E|nr:MarR family transcriptional regulator [Listeria costaricensis]